MSVSLRSAKRRFSCFLLPLFLAFASTSAMSSDAVKNACRGLPNHSSVLGALAAEASKKKVSNQQRRDKISMLQGYTRAQLSLQRAQRDKSWNDIRRIIDLIAVGSFMGATIKYENIVSSSGGIPGDFGPPIDSFLGAIFAPMHDAFSPEEREAAAILDLAGKKLVAAERVLGSSYKIPAVSAYLRSTAYGDDLAARAGLSVMCSTLEPDLIERVLVVGKRLVPTIPK